MKPLNKYELAVYNACVKRIYGDTGCEFDTPSNVNGLTEKQIDGYLGDLQKKGLIQMDDTGDYYCDGWVVAKPDGSPFLEGDFWTGRFNYNFNKKDGLYD